MLSTIPYLFLFSRTIATGTLLALSRTRWIIIWLGMELNLISFLPLITLSSSNQETEAAIKYFLAQCWGGSLFLWAASMTHYLGNTHSSILWRIISIALIIKAGIVPCHFWFPSVINSLPWILCLTLSTWQKLTPLILLFIYSSINHTLLLITVIATRNVLVGSLGGLNQTQIRPLLAYSSIRHIGWIIIVRPFSRIIASIYLFIYILLITPIMTIISQLNSRAIKNIPLLKSTNSTSLLILFLLILALAGMPPTAGFLIKLAVLERLVNVNIVLPRFILLISATINLSFYLNLIFYSYISISTKPLHQNLLPHTTPFLTIIRISLIWRAPLISII